VSDCDEKYVCNKQISSQALKDPDRYQPGCQNNRKHLPCHAGVDVMTEEICKTSFSEILHGHIIKTKDNFRRRGTVSVQNANIGSLRKAYEES
jgi:hypothetical protein